MSLPRPLLFFVRALTFVVFAPACDRHASTSAAFPSTFDASPETFDAGDLAPDVAAWTSDARRS